VLGKESPGRSAKRTGAERFLMQQDISDAARERKKLGAVRDAWIRWVNNHPRLRVRTKLVGVTYIALYPNQTLYKSEGVLVVWAGIERLRKDCGLSRGALDRHLKLLVKHSLLSPWTGEVPREPKVGRPTQPYAFNIPPGEFFEFVPPRIGKTKGKNFSHSRREKLESENRGNFSHSESNFSHFEGEFFPRKCELGPKTLDSATLPSDIHSDVPSEKEREDSPADAFDRDHLDDDFSKTKSESQTETTAIKTNSSHTTIKAKTPPPTNGTGAFESFWTQYPRKVAKLAAQKAFAQAVKKGVAPEDIIRGAMRYAAERVGQDHKYTKHPATWLNGGCWADEPGSPARQPQNRNPAVAALLRFGGNHD
jgi:hypothetical protein